MCTNGIIVTQQTHRQNHSNLFYNLLFSFDVALASVYINIERITFLMSVLVYLSIPLFMEIQVVFTIFRPEDLNLDQ